MIWNLTGTTIGDRFGLSIAAAGDLNGDNKDDVIVGAPGVFIGTVTGYAQVFSGSDGSVLLTILGHFNGDRFGYDVAGGHDVDNDGTNDIVIGAIGETPNGTSSGSVFVHSGASGLELYRFDGDAANHEFGHGVGLVGDTNGDGHAEVFATTFARGAFGYGRVFSGIDGSQRFQLDASVSGDGFGHSSDAGGDLNGDGIGDLIVGVTADDAIVFAGGAVYAYSGADGTLLKTFHGSLNFGRLGYQVSMAGDVNGDGFVDIIGGSLVVGQPGYARVFSTTAAVPYGLAGNANQTLTVAWTPGAPGMQSQGQVDISGAANSGFGMLAFSLAPVFSGQLAGVDLWVDLSPGSILSSGSRSVRVAQFSFP